MRYAQTVRARPFLLFVTLCLMSAPVFAHRGSTKLILAERTAAGARLEVELERVDVAVELGLEESASVEAVLARRDAIRAWLARGITLRSGGGECDLEAGAPAHRVRDGDRVVVILEASCPSPVDEVQLRDETIFDTDPQHEAFVRVRWGDEGDAHVLRAGRQELALGAPPSTLGLVGRFLVEGMSHLVTGYDHLLFLLSLVLTAGGLAVREGIRKAARDVAWIVTAFTLGHSVTLIAAALGWVVLPAKWVEVAIALSIVIVAGLNIARPRTRLAMPWLAFGFGLVHGFGFSGVLAELGLPASARVLSLVAFNVGIELAQLVFVAAFLWPLARLARHEGAYERWIVRGGSALIALVATYWVIERALTG